MFLIVGLVDLRGFGGFLVPGDATATAHNITAAELTYRMGVLTDIVALLLFIPLIVSLYNLLRHVDKWHALSMLLLVSVGVTIGLANVLNKIAPLMLLSGDNYLSVLTKPQLDGLALAFLDLNSNGNTVDAMFWGLWLLPFGILVIKSGFFPRILGILLIVAGLGYVTNSLTSIVLPTYTDVVSRITMPLLFGEFPIIFWLLIKGAKVPQAEAGLPEVGPSHVS